MARELEYVIAERPRRSAIALWGPLVLFAAMGLSVGVLTTPHSTRNLVLLCAVVLVYFSIFVWQPTSALLAYIAIRPLVDAFVYQSFHGFTLGELWGFGMVVSAFLFLAWESMDHVQEMRLSLVPMTFLFCLAVLTFAHPNFVAAISDWSKVASWILVMLASERISRNRRGQMMCWWAGIGMAASLAIGVGIMMLQHRYGSAFYANSGDGISGQLPHVLSSGAVLLLPFGLVGVVLVRRRKLSLALTASLVVAIILSYVRTALVGGAIVFGALLALTVRGGGKARLAGLSIAVGAGIGGYIVRSRIVQRFSDLKLLFDSGAAQGGAGSGRFEIWRAAVNGAFDNVHQLLIGSGARASEQIMTKALGMTVGAQNDFLDFLLAGGLVLGICYLVLLAWMTLSPLSILRDVTQSPQASAFALLVLGAVGAFIVMSMVNGIATYQPSVAVGLLVGLVRGMSATPGETFLDEQRVTLPGRAGRAA